MSNTLVLAAFTLAIAVSAWRRYHQRSVVSGVVVDSSSGRPLPGLRVELHAGSGPEEFVAVPTSPPLDVVTSDLQGRFEFRSLDPRGEYVLATRAGPGRVAGGGYLRLGRAGRRQKLRLGHIPRA